MARFLFHPIKGRIELGFSGEEYEGASDLADTEEEVCTLFHSGYMCFSCSFERNGWCNSERVDEVSRSRGFMHRNYSILDEALSTVYKAKKLKCQRRKTILPTPNWKGILPCATIVHESIKYFQGLLGMGNF